VWVFPIIRVKVPSVEAESQKDAIAKVNYLIDSGVINFHTMFDGPVPDIEHATNAEYADDVDGYCVDGEGDSEYKRTQWYDKDGNPIMEVKNAKL
jgi:hypothetical protein